MQNNRPPAHEDEALLPAETEQGFWGGQKKFTAQTEVAFQLEMDRRRERRIHKTGIVAVLLYGLLAVSDSTMVPDAYQQALAVRFLLVVPLMLLATVGLYKLKGLLLREILMATTVVLVALSLIWIGNMSTHPNAVRYQAGITLIALFGNIVLSLRFRSALVASTIITAIYALSLSQTSLLPVPVRFNSWLFCFATVVISLIGNFRMDQDQRRAYLARRREQARNEDLSHAVELLAKLSAEDALTQIANRREFNRRLDIEWARARRDAQPLAMIMADIDFFKNYNDHYGHPAGDACLRQVAAALKSIPKRPADIVTRFGGEEFAVLLPETTVEDAAGLAERMRKAVVDLQIPHATSRIGSGVTVSFGVAAIRPGLHDQASTLVKMADVALYEAKQNGRNRVAVQANAAEGASLAVAPHEPH